MSIRDVLLVATLAAAFGFGGCREDTDDIAGEPRAPTTAEDVRREAGDALETAAEYLGQKKDEFVARAEEQIERLEGEFHGLREQGSETASESSRKLEDLRVQVRERLKRARDELGDLRQAGGETWRKAAAEFGDALKDLREAYEDYVREYKSEREPQTTPDTARG